MAGRVPKARKPPELARRNRPEEWTVLPFDGCDLKPPSWPFGKPSAEEATLWGRVWRLPVASYWHVVQVEPAIVARYVRLALERPEHASVSKLESELGLTPAAMARLRLVVEPPEPEQGDKPDHYAHLRRPVE